MGPRVVSLAVFIFIFSVGQSFAADRDPTASDLKGIPRSHKYSWAVVGGTILGAGVGVIAPGGTKSAVKGALLGGSITSAFFLAKSPRAAEGHRPLAHIITNAALGTGILWTACNCTDGAWAGALIGGGGTAIIMAFSTHHTALTDATDIPSQATFESADISSIFGNFPLFQEILLTSIVNSPTSTVNNKDEHGDALVLENTQWQGDNEEEPK